MKTIIALGLAILSLLLVGGPRRTSISLPPVPEGKPASAESQQTSKAAQTRRAASPALRNTQQAQPVHAMLLAAVEVETDSDRRGEALEHAVESVSDGDLPVLLDSLARDASPGAGELGQLLIRRWAESDAPAAAAWTSRFHESPVHRAALEQVAIAWANADLPAAASWVRALPEGKSKQSATFHLAYEAARTEAVAALELASTLLPTRERDDLLVHAVRQWAGTDSTSAAKWSMEEPDPNLQQRLVASVAIALTERDALAAATLAANALAAGDEQTRTAVSIVQRWAQNSPEAAASWVSQFTDIPLRNAAVENLLALWIPQDAEAAGK